MRFSDFNDETKYRIYQASRDNLIKSMNDNRVGTPLATDYKIECQRLVGSIEEKMDELNGTHLFGYVNAVDSRPEYNDVHVKIDYNVEGNQNLEYEGKTRKEIDEMKTAKIKDLKIGNPGTTTGTASSAQLTQIQAELDSLKVRHGTLESEKTRIQGELDTCKNDLNNEKANSKTVEETRDTLEQTLKQKEQELSNIKDELEQVKTRLQFSEGNVTQETAKVEGLEEEKNRLEQDVLRLTQQMKASTSTTQTSVNGDPGQTAKIAELEIQISKLTSALEQINDEKANLSKEVGTLNETIINLRTEIERKTSELNNAAQEHETSANNRIKELKGDHQQELITLMQHIVEITSEESEDKIADDGEEVFQDATSTTDITKLLKDYPFLRDSIKAIENAERDTIKTHEKNIRVSLQTEHKKAIQEKEDAHAVTRSALEALKIDNARIALELRQLNQQYEELNEGIEQGSPENFTSPIVADEDEQLRSASPTSSENNYTVEEYIKLIEKDILNDMPIPKNIGTTTTGKNLGSQEDSAFIKELKAKIEQEQIDPLLSISKKARKHAEILITIFEKVMWDKNDKTENIYNALNLDDDAKKKKLHEQFYTAVQDGAAADLINRFKNIKEKQPSWLLNEPGTMTYNKETLRNIFRDKIFIEQPVEKKNTRSATPAPPT